MLWLFGLYFVAKLAYVSGPLTLSTTGWKRTEKSWTLFHAGLLSSYFCSSMHILTFLLIPCVVSECGQGARYRRSVRKDSRYVISSAVTKRYVKHGTGLLSPSFSAAKTRNAGTNTLCGFSMQLCGVAVLLGPSTFADGLFK